MKIMSQHSLSRQKNSMIVATLYWDETSANVHAGNSGGLPDILAWDLGDLATPHALSGATR